MNIDLFQIAANTACGGLEPLVAILKKGVMPLVWIGIPILLIAFGIVDLGKAVISSDEKEVKQAQGRLIKRFIYAAAVFFIVTLVSLVMGLVGTGASNDSDLEKNDTTSWSKCWRSID